MRIKLVSDAERMSVKVLVRFCIVVYIRSRKCLSDRANMDFKGWRDSFSMPIQVIGNVKNDHHLTFDGA